MLACMDIPPTLQQQTGKLHPLPASELAWPHNDAMLAGLLLCTCLLIVLLIIGRATFKKRGDRVAKPKQQSDEEKLIKRLGLLAAGSIHELGTPLTTISIILKDIQSLPLSGCEAAFKQDIDAMQREVERCKAIISSMVRPPGEDAEMTSLQNFVDSVAQAWRDYRKPTVFDYAFHVHGVSVVPDALIRQMLFNLLDNAFEASPGWVGLSVGEGQGMIVIEVQDRGKGFSAESLQSFGRPYVSGKGGDGLGLFLAVILMRELGGQAIAANTENGAKLTVTIPLGAIGAKKND